MAHEHALAHLLGLEGIALLRAFTGEHDRDFVAARLAEVRALLADESLADAAFEVDRVDPVEGYRLWAASYDDGLDTVIAIDQPVVVPILDELLAGVAVDAACGTGRYARLLVDRGHRVIGVDVSPEMLTRARDRVPGAEFRPGRLTDLPVADAEADLVVCALALTHVPELGPVFAEFARVLRPGGHLVVADVHPERVRRGAVPTLRTTDGRPVRPASFVHPIGDYLRAALPVGLRVRRCVEPVLEPSAVEPAATTPGAWDVWPWSLAAMVPAAAVAAYAGVPAMVIWQFERD